jgi:BirA family biotin operon repressor/biotin-[acetyl-CoA-carboxylase] ligase
MLVVPILQWKIIKLNEISSTQTAARKYIADDNGAGIVVLARVQTSGIGRRGQVWYSPEGGLYMTALLNPIGELGLIPLLGGVVVAEAIRTKIDVNVGLKWPNDIVLDGKKIGGILVESGWFNGRIKYILLGIGVNLNNHIPEWLPEATSLIKITGNAIDIDKFAHEILTILDHYLPYLESDPETIITSWSECSITLNRKVEITDNSGEKVSGLAVGISSDGSLLVDSGYVIKRVVTGVLQFR